MLDILSISLSCLQAACGNYDIRKGCTKNFDPVCGTDNVLYGNECLLCVQNM